ncbi:transcription elongation factor GreA [Lacticaseibacillus yichunensis]|uniref:Transcription elongation factor GreA n=1 Tax=Lacticaseibacillus yichunensis TaxID=2486015 RepID=A0ABW4CRV3_9LACO|nr:transcription elongation factor GreA [Lacticaseibacillus yichunensis]
MVTYHDITPDGLKELKAEVILLQAERPRRIKALADARALGDLSENADYSAAKRDLRHLESRLRYLDKLIRYAQVVTAGPTDIAGLGMHVTLRFEDDDELEVYHLVGQAEASMAPGNIAINSPLGRAIAARKVGDTVTVEAPSGAYQVTVVKLEA